MLDFSALSSQEDISTRFEAVARELLCNSVLTVVRDGTRTDLEILELEFYLQKSRCHEDPFTHGSKEQEWSGQWYFHRLPCRADRTQPGLPVTAAGEYRSGSRKGLDLTIGGPLRSSNACTDPSSEPTGPVTVRGGVLLRTIRRRTDKTIISGPSLLVDEILRLSGASSVDELVETLWKNDISALEEPCATSAPRTTYMYLHKAKSATLSFGPPQVFCSPRVGLDLSNPETKNHISHPRVIFVGKLYRFFTYPKLLTTKGRVQTFVGLYTKIVESKGRSYAEDTVKMKMELSRLMGLKDQNVTKYLEDYRAGYQTGELKSFVGSAGKGVCQSTTGYLRMMGTLHKALKL
ncbi:hypothetical protein F5I97DRAFT_1804462 [Phlebopus sp. FC_14]|nr:hypothetical protein F5I97DRAFT_1804462 [Phlebopus sp. FC_14]